LRVLPASLIGGSRAMDHPVGPARQHDRAAIRLAREYQLLDRSR
jgi:hypothetical protein